MSIEDLWNEALKRTEIIRLPLKKLETFGSTDFEYVFLAPSLVNQGDTVVRKGHLRIDKPSLVLPKNTPMFEGFESELSDIHDEELRSFFYMRGISLPSLKYTNEAYELDVFEGTLAAAEKSYGEEVRQKEKISTGICIGIDSAWQFSLLLLACHVIDNQLDDDLRLLLRHVRKKH